MMTKTHLFIPKHLKGQLGHSIGRVTIFALKEVGWDPVLITSRGWVVEVGFPARPPPLKLWR